MVPIETRERLLVVNGEQATRQLLGRILGHHGYACSFARDVADARAQLGSIPFDLVICDLRLPDGSGLDLVKELDPRSDLAVLVVSGLDDVGIAERALRSGAYGYIVKPFSANELEIGVLAALRRRDTERAAREDLAAASQETIERLCIVVEARDPAAAGHIAQMSECCWHIARQLGLDASECDLIRSASTMHDVGKVGVPDRILLKPGSLTPAERRRMERHAEVGYRILAGSRSRLLQLAATIAWTHHEHHDGRGYPRGLAGEAIPREGRIAAVADVFDALTHDRVYRPRFTTSEAVRIVVDGRGSHFEPEAVDAFLAVQEQPLAATELHR